MSVHSDGKLLAYSVLMTGYGLWGDIINSAESRRNQGVFRYASTLTVEYKYVYVCRLCLMRINPPTKAQKADFAVEYCSRLITQVMPLKVYFWSTKWWLFTFMQFQWSTSRHYLCKGTNNSETNGPSNCTGRKFKNQGLIDLECRNGFLPKPWQPMGPWQNLRGAWRWQ
jgi:hypothetical protein